MFDTSSLSRLVIQFSGNVTGSKCLDVCGLGLVVSGVGVFASAHFKKQRNRGDMLVVYKF